MVHLLEVPLKVTGDDLTDDVMGWGTRCNVTNTSKRLVVDGKAFSSTEEHGLELDGAEFPTNVCYITLLVLLLGNRDSPGTTSCITDNTCTTG